MPMSASVVVNRDEILAMLTAPATRQPDSRSRRDTGVLAPCDGARRRHLLIHRRTPGSP